MILLICIATFTSTLLGGLFALLFKEQKYLILAFSAGVVIGVAFFDLIPTAIELSSNRYGSQKVTFAVGSGFVAYLILNRILLSMNGQNAHHQTIRGKIAAFCLTLHSLFDGVAIGLAFQVSPYIGGIVATAVLVHDFADGINITNVIIRGHGNKKLALSWLFINSVAPLLGAFTTFYYHLRPDVLGMALAVVSGFFIYIGASDFLPDSQQKQSGPLGDFLTIAGVATIYFAVQLSGT